MDLSTLTAEERDTWAQIRDDLVAHHPVNAETLEVIDSALFMLVLEDRNPTDMKQRMELSLHGQGSHRWFDKLQVMVQPDGHLTVNFEHSFSDGTVWNRWLHECWHDMRDSDSGFAPLEEMPEYVGATKPEKLSWKLSNNLIEDVKKAEDHFSDFSGNLNSGTWCTRTSPRTTASSGSSVRTASRRWHSSSRSTARTARSRPRTSRARRAFSTTDARRPFARQPRCRCVCQERGGGCSCGHSA